MRLSEFEILSKNYDRPRAEQTPPVKIFICSTPRSGSWLLARHLINAGLGLPAEYFHPHHIPDLARRFGVPRIADFEHRLNDRLRRWLAARNGRDLRAEFMDRYIRELIGHRTVNGVFAAKIHYSHYGKYLNNRPGWEMLRGGTLVYLYRENLLHQAVSWQFSEQTGRWGFSEEEQTVPSVTVDLMNFDSIGRKIQELSHDDANWRALFAISRVEVTKVSYEELARDPMSVVGRIGKLAGLDTAGLDLSYSEPKEEPRSFSQFPSKSEITTRFLDHASRIA